MAKGEYKTALRNLEMISDEIHERRRSSAMGPRGLGVGAEGDSNSGDDIDNFKMESDGISSECEEIVAQKLVVRHCNLYNQYVCVTDVAMGNLTFASG